MATHPYDCGSDAGKTFETGAGGGIAIIPT